MLSDFNAWVRSGLENVFSYTDGDLKEALTNCYEAICYNKYKSWKLACPLKLDDVGAVHSLPMILPTSSSPSITPVFTQLVMVVLYHIIPNIPPTAFVPFT